MSISLIVYPVTDLAQAKHQFSLLMGGEPYADTPYYVGYRSGEMEIGLDPNGHQRSGSGALAYWTVNDVASELKALLSAGAELVQDVTDVAPGVKIAVAKIAGGAAVGLRQLG